MPLKKQVDAEWEPKPGERVVLRMNVDGVEESATVRWCYRHSNQSAPHPGRRDNLTRWTVSTSEDALDWIRWDFVRSSWVRAWGQKDGAPVRYVPHQTTDPDAEDPHGTTEPAADGTLVRTELLSTEQNRLDFPDPDPNDPNETAARDPDNVSGMEHAEKANYLKRRGLGT